MLLGDLIAMLEELKSQQPSAETLPVDVAVSLPDGSIAGYLGDLADLRVANGRCVVVVKPEGRVIQEAPSDKPQKHTPTTVH